MRFTLQHQFSQMIRNIYIETYGCQMNRLDSSLISTILKDAGFSIVTCKENADFILINTCAVREHAEQRVIGRINQLKALRKLNENIRFGIVGCMAQRMGSELFEDYVPLVVGPDGYRGIPTLIKDLNSNGLSVHAHLIDITPDAYELYEGIFQNFQGESSVFVSISRGCNNYCSYCIVPYTRGRLRHMPVEQILNQVKKAVQAGVREITLLGQNVNSYSDGVVTFAELLMHVSAVDGLHRLRFLTSHPKDLSPDTLNVMAQCDTLCEHLHLPVQSGSDRILSLMGRGYTVDAYLRIVDMAYALIPGVSITTDIIFGFPGETEKDFQKTLNLMRRLEFDSAYLYKYSPREGTKAFRMEGNITENERIQRLETAIKLQESISMKKNNLYVGRTEEILVSKLNKSGRSIYLCV